MVGVPLFWRYPKLPVTRVKRRVFAKVRKFSVHLYCSQAIGPVRFQLICEVAYVGSFSICTYLAYPVAVPCVESYTFVLWTCAGPFTFIPTIL